MILTDEIVEKAARAINDMVCADAIAQGLSPPEIWDSLHEPVREEILAEARAALLAALPGIVEALMSPSTKAIDAGETALEDHTDSSFSSDADGNRHDYTFVMSGAALAIHRAILKQTGEEIAASIRQLGMRMNDWSEEEAGPEALRRAVSDTIRQLSTNTKGDSDG